MVGLNPGELREKLEFYSIVRQPDGAGGFNGVPELAFVTSASVKPGKAQYSMQNDALSIDRPYDVKIRYSPARMPDLAQNVVYRGETYRIIEIRDIDAYRRYLVLTIVRKG